MTDPNTSLFSNLLNQPTLFRSKEVLRPSYTPGASQLVGRDAETRQLAGLLVAALRDETPSNVLLYGKTGTGKTAMTRFVGSELQRQSRESEKKVVVIHINCELVDTHYRVLTHIANHLIENWNERIPFTGWPTNEVYDTMRRKLDEHGGTFIVILDEIDRLVQNKGGDVLYALARLNEDLTKARVGLIGISNDLKFTEWLDPRVRGSLGEEEIVLHPYTPEGILAILKERAKLAFNDGVLEQGVLNLITTLASAEHGDARRAIDLLRTSAEIAEREGHATVNQRHVKKAQAKLETDRVAETIRLLPIQNKAVLYSILQLEKKDRTEDVMTGQVYDAYREVCADVKLDVLTQRRVTDLISELDMLGILEARVVSKGRYGRTKVIRSTINADDALTMLLKDNDFEAIALRGKPRIPVVVTETTRKTDAIQQKVN